MGNNRFMVVSEEKDIIAMNPSYVEQKGKSLIIYMPGTYKQVFVEGRYSSYSYGKDGDKKYMTEIVAEFVAMPLDIKKPQAVVEETGSGNFEQFGTAQSELPPQNDDLPF